MSKEVVKKRVRRVKKEDISHKENKHKEKSIHHKEHQKISRDDAPQPKHRDKEKEKRTEWILRIIMAVLGLVILLIGIYICVSHFSTSNKIVKKLAEGNAYLDNQEYENAIEIYKEALELNPDSTEIKNHISNVYIMIAQTLGETDEAIDVYQTALAYNIGNVSAYWGVANIFEGRGDEANMMSALTTGYTNTGDVNIGAKLDAIQAEKDRIQAEADALAAEQAAEEAERAAQEEANNQLLQPLLELFEQEDMDGVKDLIRGEAYVTMSDELINAEDVYYCGEKDADGNKSGKGVGAYANGYYYYGDYAGNMRSGSGIWVRAVYSESSSIGSYIFKGAWSDDKPNGTGEATSNFYKDKIGSTGLVKQVITGSYSNGLEEGKMSMTGTTKAGKTLKYAYETSGGVAKKISNEKTGVEGQYYIGKTSSSSDPMLMSDDSPRGVEGFIE
ncbi:MAG: tetratricopeptide repeat protein [bacterium]|nr:tetratricopeptide repeat protein [bacterium]